MNDTQPAPVLAWHREAALNIEREVLCNEAPTSTVSAIIAAHDPHQETVRLLELAKQELAEARKFIDGQISISPKDASALLACTENRIRAHLAKLKEGTK